MDELLNILYKEGYPSLDEEQRERLSATVVMTGLILSERIEEGFKIVCSVVIEATLTAKYLWFKEGTNGEMGRYKEVEVSLADMLNDNLSHITDLFFVETDIDHGSVVH